MKKGIAYAFAIIGLLFFLWIRQRNKDVSSIRQIKSIQLPDVDQAKAIIDVKHHTITIVKRTKEGTVEVKKQFLSSNGAAVEVRRDASMVVTSPAWGTETGPFMGGAFGSDLRLRAAVGLNLFYFHEWELGAGMLLSNNVHDTRLFTHISYNPYSTIYVALGVDNRRVVNLMAGLKF